MSGAAKNPFEVFGLSPDMADRLGERELFSLVRAAYRTLQMVYHPDRGRGKSPRSAAEDAARAVELNLAFEELNLEKDPDAFRRHQRAYAARRGRGLKRKIAELEREVEGVRESRADLADGYMSYLLSGLPWLQTDEFAPGRLNPPSTKLGLNDVAINQNVRTANWRLGSNYKEIIFDALGAMLYRPVGRSKPFAVNYIHLLGVVPVDEIDLVPIMDRVKPRPGFFKSPALDSRYGIDGAPLEVLNTITPDKFKTHCLPLLRAELAERSYLFSVHRPTYEEEGLVTVEGVIVKISPL